MRESVDYFNIKDKFLENDHMDILKLGNRGKKKSPLDNDK